MTEPLPSITPNQKSLTEHITNLIQYFYIVGLDPEITFQSSIFKDTHIHLVPKVISKYPNCDLPYLSIPNSIIVNHCFPNGIQIINNIKEHVNESFIFSLDNPSPTQTTSMFDTRKVHFSCFLFTEPIEDYAYFFRKKFPGVIEDSLTFQKQIPKAICLCSFFPFHSEYVKILRELRKFLIDPPKGYKWLPVEKIVENLVFGLPAVPRGVKKIHYKFLDEKITHYFEQPRSNERPCPQYNLSSFINDFTIDQVFKLVKCIILEIPIVVFCENKSYLSNVVEGLVSLIYPFEYPYSVIPIMPKENFPLIETLPCYVLGFNRKYTNKFFEDNEIQVGNKNIVIVQMDGKKWNEIKITQRTPIENMPLVKLVPNGVMNFYLPQNIFDTIELPIHYKEKTTQKIKDYLSSKKKMEGNLTPKVQYDFKNYFNYFFFSILLGYQDYLIPKEKITPELYEKKLKKTIKLKEIFEKEKYLKILPKLDHPFYRLLFKTTIFKNFLYKKVFPQNWQDKLDILLFDESQAHKLNKKVFKKKMDTPFLSTEQFNHKEQTIKLVEWNFTKKELQFLESKHGSRKAFDYFQKVTKLKEEKKLVVKYKLFPKLMNDGIFFNEIYYINHPIENYESLNFIPIKNNNFEQFENLCKKALDNSERNSRDGNRNYDLNIINKFDESNLTNYPKLLWLRFFSLTFCSLSLIDKTIKYDEMTNILKNSDYIDNNTYLYIFNAIINYGTSEMIFDFFGRMRKKEYIFFLMLKDKVEQLADTFHPPLEELRKLVPNTTALNRCKIAIEFFTIIKCTKQGCKGEIDIYKNIPKFSKETTEIEVECPLCTAKNPAVIKIKVTNKETLIENVTSFKLLSPYYLYKSEKNYYGNKLNPQSYYNENHDRYWNLIWYFAINDLSYDFLFGEKKGAKELNVSSDKIWFNPEPIYPDEVNYDLSSNVQFFKEKVNEDVKKKKHKLQSKQSIEFSPIKHSITPGQCGRGTLSYIKKDTEDEVEEKEEDDDDNKECEDIKDYLKRDSLNVNNDLEEVEE